MQQLWRLHQFVYSTPWSLLGLNIAFSMLSSYLTNYNCIYHKVDGALPVITMKP